MNNIFINNNDIDGLQFGSSSVSKVYFGSNLVYEDAPIPNYLQFTAVNGDATIGLDRVSMSPNVSYSFDGTNWTTWDYSDITITSGSTVYMKGNNPNGFTTGTTTATTVDKYSKFVMTGTVEANGNVMSLLYEDNFEGEYVLPSNWCFAALFSGCTSLTTAPELPATGVTYNCYRNMFHNTSIVETPELPAITLASSCYQNMFHSCTSLTTAPTTLPATSLASSCYQGMFLGCTSLTTAPVLPATTLATYCYSNMFEGCSSLTSAPELTSTTLTERCYYGMFAGCASLTSAPQLPATTLATTCYANMFRGCTSLTTAPVLPAKTLVSQCYNNIFTNCSSLNYIKAMFTTTPSTSYTSNWVQGVASSGTYVKNSSASYTTRGTSAIPNNWTVQTASS